MNGTGEVAIGETLVQEREAAAISRTRRWGWAAALLVAVILLTNLQLLRGKVAPQWDAVDFFGPSFSLTSDYVRALHLPLWNPWVSGGSPDFAEPELGATSPILLITAGILHNPRTGFVVYWMMIWIGAGLGVLLFAKHLGCPPWGGVIGALGFVASGFFLGHSQHTSSLFSIALLPWICWRFDDALLTRRYWSAVQAGILYGLSGLGGYPQFTILTPGFLALWAVGRILFRDGTGATDVVTLEPVSSRAMRSAGCLLVIGVLGALVFCTPYLGFMTETHGYSDRVGPRSRVESITSNSLPAGAFSTLASPYLSMLTYGSLPNRLWPESDISMSSIYSGAVVSVLALLAILSRSGWQRWLALVTAFFLCCSVGYQLPVRGWLYDYVLPTRYFRNSSMFSVYSIFLLCTFAALAARDLENAPEGENDEARRLLTISYAGAVAAITTFFVIVHRFADPPFEFGLAMVQLVATWLGILFIAFLLVMRLAPWRRCVQLLVGIAVLDACLSMVVSQPVMYASADRDWWQRLGREHVSALDMTSRGLYRQLHDPAEFLAGGYPGNRNVVVKVAVLDSYQPFSNHFENMLEADPLLPSFALGDKRIWFAGEAQAAPPTDQVFAQFADALRKQQRPTIVVHTPEQMKALSAKQPASSQTGPNPSALNLDQVTPASLAEIELVRYLPDSLEFRFNAPTQGWLMVTDRWAPGWHAEVNGKAAEVYGADFLFRAIKVDAGMNSVRFWYQPRTWLVSVLVSWGTLLAFAVVSLVRFVRGRTQGVAVHG